MPVLSPQIFLFEKPSLYTTIGMVSKKRQWSQQEVADAVGTTQRNVSRWERGLTTPGPYFRTKLSTLFGKSPQQLGLLHEYLSEEPSRDIPPQHSTVEQPLPLWHVPYRRNPFFTGREDLLRHLHQTLSQNHTLTLAQSLAISGLGGIGKTQVALEYAYQYRSAYRFVFWANAATREALLADIMAIADRLQLPE
ncbi:MAG TPA: helix-turn-helix transcriptional regulator, partial [Ktedonobacteraceae bacterium]|nr:helix-turn-helix transcriptional regulator [Ktedonobacteraceae bacterium]